MIMCRKKNIQSVLVDYQRGLGRTLRVKPLTWGHRPNFGSPGIWVVTKHDLLLVEGFLKNRLLRSVVRCFSWLYGSGFLALHGACFLGIGFQLGA